MLLQNPTAQKLDPCWTGPWTVTEIKSPITIAIARGNTTRVVHVNHICPFLEVQDSNNSQTASWNPPLFQHLDVKDSNSRPTSSIMPHNAYVPPPVVTRSGRVVKPVVRYGQVDN